MNKFFFILLSLSNYNFFIVSDVYLQKNDTAWKMCKEINDEEEACIEIDVKELQKIHQLMENNHYQTQELIKNIVIAQIRSMHTLIKTEWKKQIKQPKATDKELEEFSNLQPQKKYSSPPKSKYCKFNLILDADIIKMLPEEEQKMLSEIEEYKNKSV